MVQNPQSPSKTGTGKDDCPHLGSRGQEVDESVARVLEQHGQGLGLSDDGQEVRVAAPPGDDVLVQVGAHSRTGNGALVDPDVVAHGGRRAAPQRKSCWPWGVDPNSRVSSSFRSTWCVLRDVKGETSTWLRGL